MRRVLAVLLVAACAAHARTVIRLHLERFNRRYNLYHIGVSATAPHRSVRFDYRAFNDNHSYVTVDERHDPREPRDVLAPRNALATIGWREMPVERKTVVWGVSDLSVEDICCFERGLRRKYVLGVYDCRHYTRDMTRHCLDRPSPVWSLDALWHDLPDSS